MSAKKNAPKMPYSVPVTTKDGLVPAGTPVVIDAESSASILATFGPYKGPSKTGDDGVEAAVKKALDAQQAKHDAAMAAARDAFEEFMTLPDEADVTTWQAALNKVTVALGGKPTADGSDANQGAA